MTHHSHNGGTSMFTKGYRRKSKPAARPGAIHIPAGAIKPTIRMTCYGPAELEDKQNCTFEDVQKMRGKHPVQWVDIVGMGDETLFEQIGKLFGIHRLALEDVVNIPQRAKVENFKDHLFLVCQFPRHGKKHTFEQASFFVGKDFVISWREHPSDCFDTIRDRLQFTGRALRDMGTDYLMYALLDALIDSYFPSLERIGDQIDRIDVELEGGPSRPLIIRLHGLRHDLRLLRRIVWPLRDAVDSLTNRHEWLITPETSIYLRDCHDHVVRIIDSLESYREACSDLRDFYSTEVGNRMNEVMKVLTIISTIFIPLSFMVGLYGMNFDPDVSSWNMPELKWRYGYPAVLLLMSGVTIGQLLFFRRKGWLSSFTTVNNKSHANGEIP
ncbi:magnesium/cobalt transporter CorA [Bythopirellula polymerisocia]|uniref:Magnesium transport protein CorA n=1 Tax=Bythopirellula polymerisocia TaxID=2528003 RepID=A0A5C6CB09_9BACT|nr:magnesium/cobalt transporter CorA [Bythopirellula polymerisocia]TWU21275.1 Magnesium transport protein CorA [Bythopirellula polymerisocia]